MINEQPNDFEKDNTEILDSSFVKICTEIVVQNTEIQEELKQKGFTQFYPAYSGFSFDTIPPGLSKEQYEQWQLKEEQRRKEYIDNMDPLKKEMLKNEDIEYERTLKYLKPKVISSLELIKENRYGLKDVFDKAAKKEPINTTQIINTMKSNKINVLEYPQQEIGFDGKENHGESRYSNGQWTVKFNKIALSDSREILHEYIAIEAFDYYLRTKPSFREALTTLPIGLLVMTTGKSTQESLARGQYIKKHMMTIPILENLYRSISAYRPDSEFLKEFSETVKK